MNANTDTTTKSRTGEDLLAQVHARPTVSVPLASELLGMSRSQGYDMAARGDFPCRTIKLGRKVRVVSADLLRLLGLEP